MTEIPNTSFQHPMARSAALRPKGVLDRISLRDHIVSVEIGAFEVERSVTQRLSFNVVVEVSDVAQPLEDDVDKILSYDRVTEAISAALSAARVNLLETLADDIATRILAEPQAQRVFVRIEKLDRGVGDLGVEIVRDGSEAIDQTSQTDAASPLIVITSEMINLSEWLPVFKRHPRPVLLLPFERLQTPKTQNAKSNQRLELLAWDSAAWRLAALMDEVSVVGSRTEMDWGVGQGQVNVWAPMKLILDSPTPPQSYDIVSLANWIAELTQGTIVCLGCKVGSHIALSEPAGFLELP